MCRGNPLLLKASSSKYHTLEWCGICSRATVSICTGLCEFSPLCVGLDKFGWPDAERLDESREFEFVGLGCIVILQKYEEMKTELITTERHLLKEMGFICHVEHPHKFIINYILQLDAHHLMQDAWSMANDRYITAEHVQFGFLNVIFEFDGLT
jgi:hypothetical protein